MILKDADALKEIFKQQERWHFTGIIAAIDDVPTIDAVPVVRCKDCKYWGNKQDWGGRRVGICDLFEILTDANGYCYRADRKEVQDDAG